MDSCMFNTNRKHFIINMHSTTQMDSNETMLGLKYPRTLLIYKVYAIKKKKNQSIKQHRTDEKREANVQSSRWVCMKGFLKNTEQPGLAWLGLLHKRKYDTLVSLSLSMYKAMLVCQPAFLKSDRGGALYKPLSFKVMLQNFKTGLQYSKTGRCQRMNCFIHSISLPSSFIFYCFFCP